MRVLIAEDHVGFARNLIEYLTDLGHEVDHAVDGQSALSIIPRGGYDAVILDLGLPRLDGLTVCRSIRALDPDLDILVLTSREAVADKVEAFEAGADDFVTKPGELREIAARLTALARRAAPRQPDSSRQEGGHPSGVLQVADLRFDLGTQEVRRGARAIILHRIGRELLALLLRRSPQVVSRAEIEQEIWHGEPPGSEVIRTHIYAIRKAVEEPGSHPLVHTVRGSGYRIAETEQCGP